MSVNGIFWHSAADVWPRISPLFQRCLDKFDSGYLLADLLAAIQQRQKQLWLINDGQAAAITSVHALPQWKILCVEYLAGDGMPEWQDEWFSEMQAYAQSLDCKYIEAPGRKGWARMARQRGDTVEVMNVSRKLV